MPRAPGVHPGIHIRICSSLLLLASTICLGLKSYPYYISLHLQNNTSLIHHHSVHSWSHRPQRSIDERGGGNYQKFPTKICGFDFSKKGGPKKKLGVLFYESPKCPSVHRWSAPTSATALASRAPLPTHPHTACALHNARSLAERYRRRDQGGCKASCFNTIRLMLSEACHWEHYWLQCFFWSFFLKFFL